MGFPKRRGAKRMGRDHRLDIVRIVAMTFVVGVHTVGIIDRTSTAGYWYWLVLQQILFTCNPLFFMLSGKLNIKERNEHGVIAFYKTKVRNILIPTLIFFLFYAIFLNYESGSLLEVIKGFVKGSISEYASSPYWFMFTLIGFLAFAPFLGRAFNNLKKTHLICFMVICLGYNTFQFFGNNLLSVGVKWTYPFAGYGFIFCFGAFIDRVLENERICKMVIGLSPLCLAINTGLMAAGFHTGVCDISPFFCLFAVGIYCAIIKLSDRVDFAQRMKLADILQSIARYSFYVYMAHVFVLDILIKYFLGFTGAITVILQVCACFLIVLVSFLLAVVVKKIVITPVQAGFDLLFDTKK